MRKKPNALLWLGTLTAGFIFLAAFPSSTEVAREDHLFLTERNDKLKKDAFEILDTKCNVCHRRQNPFMIFHEIDIKNSDPILDQPEMKFLIKSR